MTASGVDVKFGGDVGFLEARVEHRDFFCGDKVIVRVDDERRWKLGRGFDGGYRWINQHRKVGFGARIINGVDFFVFQFAIGSQ